MSGSEKETQTESAEQGKESSQKWVTEWSQFRESNDKLLLWMTQIKDTFCLKEVLGAEGSEEAVQMAELWTQVLDDLQPRNQLWDRHFEAIMGNKMTKTGKGQCRYDVL